MNFDTLHWISEGFIRSAHDRFNLNSLSLTYISSAMLFNMNFDLSVVIAVLGGLGGASAVVKNSLESYKTYLSIKKDKVQADKMIKELDKEESEDSDKDNGSNI